MRRLVLCFDGTWNTVQDHTNVSRIHAAIPSRPRAAAGEVAQLKYYDEGVGTTKRDRVRGGALGMGTGRNIREAYRWLAENYEAGDELYLFGFSRGAFTARSLSGLIECCSIVRADAGDLDARVEEGYRLYRGKGKVAQRWEFARRHGHAPTAKAPADDDREQLPHAVSVKFIGVWDTVGALGVPGFDKAERFHNTTFCRNVERGYQALAIDEHRKDYAAILWNVQPELLKPTQIVEQRWFPGAHSNVGGGYEDDLLCDPPLAWIAENAHAAGLELSRELFQLSGGEFRSPVRDSYKEFIRGIYARVHGRYHRPIGTARNETIDETAFLKWSAEPSYRPRSLSHLHPTIAAPAVGVGFSPPRATPAADQPQPQTT